MNLFLPGLGLGVMIGAVTHLIYSRQPDIQFDPSSAKAVLEKLRPLTRRGEKTEAYIYLWADGTINVTVELDYNEKISGSGNSLREAVENLKVKSAMVSGALQ